MLDFLPANDEWLVKEISIGRRRGDFQVKEILVALIFSHSIIQLVFEKAASAKFDAVVAVDDVAFMNCDLPQGQDEGQCNSDKLFRCANGVRESNTR